MDLSMVPYNPAVAQESESSVLSLRVGREMGGFTRVRNYFSGAGWEVDGLACFCNLWVPGCVVELAVFRELMDGRFPETSVGRLLF